MPGGGYICKDLKEAMDTRVQKYLVYRNRSEQQNLHFIAL